MSTSVNIFRNTHSSSSSGGGKEEQTKSVTITENGTTTVTPDEGKTLASVTVNTAVSSGGSVGRGVYYDTSRTYPRDWHKVEPFLSGRHATFRIPNNMNIGVVVSTDGLEPDVYNYSNFLLSLDNVLNLEYGVGFLYEQDGIMYTAEIFVETPYIPQ